MDEFTTENVANDQTTPQNTSDEYSVKIEHEGIRQEGKIYFVDIDKVTIVSDHNPRKHFDGGEDQNLAEDIAHRGVMTPILLNLVDGKLNLLDGERRLRASYEAKAGNPERGIIPATIWVGPMTELEKAKVAHSANKHKDLRNSEAGREIYKLMKLGMNQGDVAKFMGKSGGWVSKMKRVVNCIDEVCEALDAGKITVDQMAAISKLGGKEQLVKLQEAIGVRSERKENQYAARAETMAETRAKREGLVSDLPTVTETLSAPEWQPNTADELGMDAMDRQLAGNLGDETFTSENPVQATMDMPPVSRGDGSGATKPTKPVLRFRTTPQDVAQQREDAIKAYTEAETDYDRGLCAGLVRAYSVMLGMDDDIAEVLEGRPAA